MNLGTALKFLAANGPTLETWASDIIHAFKHTTAPSPVTVPGPTPDVEPITKKPSDAVKALQEMLNLFHVTGEPLDVDGWLGVKTEKAILAGVAKLKPYASMLGG